MRTFWLLVLPPLAIAGYLAVRVTQAQETLRRHEVDGLLQARLAEMRGRTSHAVATVERQLDEHLAAAPIAAADLRALGRRMPYASQLFRLDRDGRLLYPVPGPDASPAEREFLDRTASIWDGRAILASGTPSQDRAHATGTAPGLGDSLVDLALQDERGWLAWYWAEGIHVLFWRRAADGGVVGAEVERIGLLARVVGALPTTASEDGRIELADSAGLTVYQWGQLAASDAAPRPRADLALALEAPLDSWQLRYYMSPAQHSALLDGSNTGAIAGIVAALLAALTLAAFTYREYTRRLRDAAQRVGFVTRVSHELRTPLTNIRMYAELLEAHADDDQARRARVIVGESQRLGRLIDNVLAFARHQQGKLANSHELVDVNAAVRDTVAKFEPAFASRAIALELELDDRPAAVRAGADAVEQIVTNLMSNVEKYAAGSAVTVSTRANGDRVVVGVADRGPGVRPHERDKIFEPFHRASDALTEATTGTGIGLAIARELARAAGGDLVLADTERGARFELTLPVAREEPCES